MRFIKTFLPFGFMAVLLTYMFENLGDNNRLMICMLGLFGWLEYLELRYKVGMHQ